MSQPLTPEVKFEVLQQQSFVQKTFIAICKKSNIPQNKFFINLKKLGEAIVRTLRREEFYNIYHAPHMSEIKLMALLAFWLLKYKPFCSKETNISYVAENINEYIAINLICLSASATRRNNKTGSDIEITPEGYKQLVYRFKNWDLSKESLMTLADLLYFYDGTKIDNLDTGESTYGRVGRVGKI